MRRTKILAALLLLLTGFGLSLPSPSQPLSPPVLAAAAQVISFFGDDYRIGSGSFVTPDRILTNAHVVREALLDQGEGCGNPIPGRQPQADLIVVRTPKAPPADLNPMPRYLAAVVAEDLEHDLAVLELRWALQLQGVPETPTLEQVVQAVREGRFSRAELGAIEQPFLERRAAEEVQLGDRVALLGWPESLGGDVLILEDGSVSAKRAQDLLINGFNMEGFGLAGISGGPLILRATEELVGVICGKEVIWLKALRSELAETLLPPLPRSATVKAQRPQASFSFSPSRPLIRELITFDASNSEDPDGQIVKYSWDFGDEFSLSGLEPRAEHIYTHPGTVTVTLTVTDNTGLTDSTSQTFTLPPPPEILEIYFPESISADGRDVSGYVHFRDPDGDVIRAEFKVLEAEHFESFSRDLNYLRGQTEGTFLFTIATAVSQRVLLELTLIDAAGNHSQPKQFAFVALAPLPPGAYMITSPLVYISTSAIDFGAVELGSTVTKSFTIWNNEPSNWRPNRVRISSDNPLFTVFPQSFVLGSGEFRDINVTFMAREVGSAEGTLTITTDDPNRPQLFIDLSASVVPPPPRLVDDFSNSSSGWTIRSDAEAEMGYAAGEYGLLVKQPNRIVWSLAPLRQQLGEEAQLFNNFELTVEARQASGPVGQYGVLFRFQDGDNFYAFSITSAGLYRLDKRVGGEWVNLRPWTPSPAIRTGLEVNRLRVRAIGPQIEIAVNDQPLVTVVDEEAALAEAWEIALFAGAFDEPGVEVRFDNFEVQAR